MKQTSECKEEQEQENSELKLNNSLLKEQQQCLSISSLITQPSQKYQNQQLNLTTKIENLRFLGDCYVLHFQMIKFYILILFLSFVFCELTEIILYGHFLHQTQSHTTYNFLTEIISRNQYKQQHNEYSNISVTKIFIIFNLLQLAYVYRLVSKEFTRKINQNIQHYICMIKGDIPKLNLQTLDEALQHQNIIINKIELIYDSETNQCLDTHAFIIVNTPNQKSNLLNIYGKKWYKDFVNFMFFEEYFPKQYMHVDDYRKRILQYPKSHKIKKQKYIRHILSFFTLSCALNLSSFIFYELQMYSLQQKVQHQRTNYILVAISYTIIVKLSLAVLKKVNEYRLYNIKTNLVQDQIRCYLSLSYFTQLLVPYLSFKTLLDNSKIPQNEAHSFFYKTLLYTSIRMFIGVLFSKSLKFFFIKYLRIFYHKYIKRNYYQLTEEQLNKINAPPDMDFPKNVNGSLKMFVLCFGLRENCYLLTFLGLLYLICDYYLEKYMLLKIVRRPQYFGYQPFLSVPFVLCFFTAFLQITKEEDVKPYQHISSYQKDMWGKYSIYFTICLALVMVYYYFYEYKLNIIQNAKDQHMTYDTYVQIKQKQQLASI